MMEQMATLGSLVEPTASALYLDPNSGSLLLQLLLGGVAGVAVAGRLLWHRIVVFFSTQKRDDDASG